MSALTYVRKIAATGLRLSEIRVGPVHLFSIPDGTLLLRWELLFWAAALPAVAASLFVAPGPSGILGASLALIVIAIARIDARELIIPNSLVLAVFTLGLCNAAATSPAGPLEGLGFAIVRGTALGLLFFILQSGYRRLRRREGLGMGDVKLAAAGGTWLDWSTIPVVIEIAALAALTVYLSSHLVRHQNLRLTPASRLPFGLFLAPAIWLGWLLQNYGMSSFIEIGN